MRRALPGFSVLEATDEVTTLAITAACRPEVLVLDATDSQRAAGTLRVVHDDFRAASMSTVYVVDEPPVGGALAEGFGGADDYLVCPFESEELCARVRLALRRGDARRRANPLTRLPGNASVMEELASRCTDRRPFSCLHVDVDDFKSFNDRHGFARGDELIRTLARCLVRVLEERWTGEHFVGHVGGDDFVVLTAPECAAEVAAEITRCPSVEPCSVSVGVVHRAHELDGPDKIAEAAAMAKAEAKRQPGSCWALYGW